MYGFLGESYRNRNYVDKYTLKRHVGFNYVGVEVKEASFSPVPVDRIIQGVLLNMPHRHPVIILLVSELLQDQLEDLIGRRSVCSPHR